MDEDGSLVNKAGHNCTDIKGPSCGQDVLDDDAMEAYVSTVGACRGGASPSSNAGLSFYRHRNCEALCDADAGCTGYVLPVSGSNWCETYTSIGATGDGR